MKRMKLIMIIGLVTLFAPAFSQVSDEDTKMPKLNGKIYFNSGKKDYFMIYDEVIWFEDLGWYGVDIGKIDEKSKENEPEEVDRSADEDSAMMMLDTIIARPDTAMKAIKTKSVEKTIPVKPGSKPVKIKSQMPANKPE